MSDGGGAVVPRVRPSATTTPDTDREDGTWTGRSSRSNHVNDGWTPPTVIRRLGHGAFEREEVPIGRLDLVPAGFDEIETTELVEDEVLVEGEPGTATLEQFRDDVAIRESPVEAERVAQLEGIAVADASVILLADEGQEILLANDKGLIEVARSHGVDWWWVTTLLLKRVKAGVLDADRANDVLYDLVGAGMNLSPQGYVQVQKKLDDVGE